MGRRGLAARRLAGALLLLAAHAALAQPGEAAQERRRAEAGRLMNDLMLGRSVGGDFTLSDARGKRRALAEFRGKVVVLYFGFVTCPDVCPTDLLAIGAAVKSLGAAGDGVQPLFVTLDPARDTRGILREYVANFHPRFVALTGTEAEVRAVASAYKVFFEKVALAGEAGYTIDHAAFVYLIDREGRYVGFLPPGTPPDRIARYLSEELRAPRHPP